MATDKQIADAAREVVAHWLAIVGGPFTSGATTERKLLELVSEPRTVEVSADPQAR